MIIRLGNIPMSIFNATRLIGKTVLVTGASSGIGAVRPIHFHHVHLEIVKIPGHCYTFRQGILQLSGSSLILYRNHFREEQMLFC
jgi:hypothetical protein